MPRAKKSPAFQLYTKDLLSDANVMAMELEEFGAYVKLLAICWNEKGLPTDPDRLSKLLHVSRTKFDGLWNVVGPCFFNSRGKFQQKRLDEERRKQDKFRKSRQINGLKGGRPKGTTRLALGSEKEALLSAFAFASADQDQDPIQASGLNSTGAEAKTPSTPNPIPHPAEFVSNPPVTRGFFEAREHPTTRGAVEPRACDESPIALVFPTVGTKGSEWRLRRRQVEEWQAQFPGVDVLAEAQRALAWIRAGPERRKTVQGMPRFLVGWLNRATDRAPSQAGAGMGKTAGNIAAASRFIERGKP